MNGPDLLEKWHSDAVAVRSNWLFVMWVWSVGGRRGRRDSVGGRWVTVAEVNNIGRQGEKGQEERERESQCCDQLRGATGFLPSQAPAHGSQCPR